MKGQSIIVEFILFFLISFSFFTVVGYFFYNQNQYFSEEIFEYQTKTLNDVMITATLKSNECKSCKTIIILEEIPRKIGGKFFTIEFNTSYGINTTSLAKEPFSTISPIFNLNETYTLSGQGKSLNKKTQIKINNNVKTIRVG